MATAEITVRVAGIPAIARTTHASYSRPDHRAENAEDYFGGWSLTWELCDRRGRPAPWLERKASKTELAAIEHRLADALDGDCGDDY